MKIASYNCRSIRNSLQDVIQLYGNHDIICLQEHWLLPCDLHMLQTVHKDFNSIGYSSVDLGADMLVKRPYGGTAILYKKCFARAIQIVPCDNSRVTIIKITFNKLQFAIFSVYMPTDYRDIDSLNDYIATCTYIESLISELDVNYYCVVGDMNCDVMSTFYPILNLMASDNGLIFSDKHLLKNMATYFSNDGLSHSWIDHVLCSTCLHNCITNIELLNDFICSDHRPLSIDLNCAFAHCISDDENNLMMASTHTINWDNVSYDNIVFYQSVLDAKLAEIDVNVLLGHCYGPAACPDKSRASIDWLYNVIVCCMISASDVFCVKKSHLSKTYSVPGWNDIVSDKHLLARNVFLEWCNSGKSKTGSLFREMLCTRAEFKAALRYCKKLEEQIRADKCEFSLDLGNAKAFWKTT